MKRQLLAIRKLVLTLLKKDVILTISAVFAILSMLLVPPSKEYVDYIDFRVLALLFCLMVVVAGLQECGLFVLAARKLLSGSNHLRLLSFILIMLPFFSAMFVTNDVSLITFVPFTILILNLMGQKKHLALIVVLQTIGANLGSMATPVGNPQNLYLYGKFSIPASGFFATLLPLAVLSFFLLTLWVFTLPKQAMEIHFEEMEASFLPVSKAVFYFLLFGLCLLSVFRLLPYGMVLGIVICGLFFFDRPLFKSADYPLLFTFVAFFIFAGNMGRVHWVKTALSQALSLNPILFSALASQFISNVPAAVLLSGFTEDWKALLIGTNLGGLGTPIASLASLISLKFYIREMPGSLLRYLSIFTALNAGFFLILYGAAAGISILF